MTEDNSKRGMGDPDYKTEDADRDAPTTNDEISEVTV